jgi:hypothetical protein
MDMSEIDVEVTDANAEQRERISQLEERLDRLERERMERPGNLAELLDRLVPSEVRQHLRAARREQLLAARAWIDVIINRMDEAETKGGRRRRIEVE